MGFIETMHWLIQSTVYLGLTAVTGGLFMLYWYQTSLIYPSHFPEGSRQQVATPDEYGMHDYEDITITAPDNVKIKAYLIKRRKREGSETLDFASVLGEGLRKRAGDAEKQKEEDKGEMAEHTLIYCHANAGNMGHRLPIARVFYERCNCNVLMFSYRGYGLSDGKPSEKGLKLDAQAALDYVLSHPQLKDTKIAIYGQSIGGAVAINLAAENQDKISALIVENTFLSLPKVVPHILPYVKYLTFLCHQVWDSEKTIQRITRMPILLLSGGKDELIPPSHMGALCRVARDARRGNRKASSEHTQAVLPTDEQGIRFLVFANGTHNETCMQRGYFDAVVAFWKEWVLGTGVTGNGETVVPQDKGQGQPRVMDAVRTVQKGGEGGVGLF